MYKIYITFLAFMLSMLSLSASSPWLKRPLHFVSADSVMVWGYDGRDCRSMSRLCSKDATIYPILLTQKEWKARKQIYKEWRAKRNDINVVGGIGVAPEASNMYDVAATLTRAMQLFRMQGDAQYADYAERALYNAVLHSVNDSTLSQGSIDKQLAANLLFSMPGLIYATSADNDVYVNLFTNSTAGIHTANTEFVLDQITDMPLNGSVKLRFSNLKHDLPIRLHLRMPEWVVSRKESVWSYIAADSITPSVFVNGHEIEHFKVDEKGYLVIDRTWHDMDEVYVDFPLQLQHIISQQCERKAKGEPLLFRDNWNMQLGPLVYCIKAQGHYSLPQWLTTLQGELSASGFPVCNVKMSKGQVASSLQDSCVTLHRVVAYADGNNEF